MHAAQGSEGGGRPERFYRPELDGLRFLAFFAVYLNHTLLFGVENRRSGLTGAIESVLGTVGVAGAFGVDLFFALSAYLITELLLRERLARGTLDVRAFYTRRILRIWPLYFAFLALARVLAMTVRGEELSWSHFFAFALFSGNWMYILHPVPTVAAPLWSVSVEEQFYIVWPLAVRRASSRAMANMALGILAVGVVVRFVIAHYGCNEPWVSKSSFTRADAIATGILLALVLRGRVPRLTSRTRAGLTLASLATLFVVARACRLFEASAPTVAIVFGWPAVALACTAILVAALGSEGSVGALLRAPAFVYLGRISYGLYVFHQVGLLIGDRLFPEHAHRVVPMLGQFVVGLAVTLPLAAASYRWLESPFLRLKARRFSVVPSRVD